MEWLLLAVVIVILAAISSGIKELAKDKIKTKSSNYKYSRRDFIMTAYEAEFFKRLERLAGQKYYIFPQIHLSSLLENKTAGKYYKAGYQRLRRYAVDYVLVDKQTMVTKYAIELDDRSHDARNRKMRDTGLEADLYNSGVKLVRFRNVKLLSDDDITSKFIKVNNEVSQ